MGQVRPHVRERNVRRLPESRRDDDVTSTRETELKAEAGRVLRSWGWADGYGELKLANLLAPENLLRTWFAVQYVQQAQVKKPIHSPRGYFALAWRNKWQPLAGPDAIAKKDQQARERREALAQEQRRQETDQIRADNAEAANLVGAIRSRMPAPILAAIKERARLEVPYPPEDWLFEAAFKSRVEALILAYKDEPFSRGPREIKPAPGRTSPAPDAGTFSSG